MPSVLTVLPADNPGPSDPFKWLAGQVVGVYEENHVYGWYEFPQNSQGTFTVAQINNTDPTTLPLYATVILSDSGEITNSGFGQPIQVVTGDAIALMSDDAWYNYGQRTDTPIARYHIRVEDRTTAETSEYLEAYNKKLQYTSDQFDPATDNRRFTTTNVRVSASGNNGFTTQGINDAIAEWNTNYPSNTVVLNDTDNLTFFQCDGIMPVELFDQWKTNAQEVALADYYARRRWYINSQGLTALSNNNGIISGLASDVSGFLNDGLLE